MTNDNVKIYEVINADGSKFRFKGEKIASVSAELPSKERWTEFHFFATEEAEWVLQGVGRSRVPGEVDKFWIVLSDDAMDIVNAVVGNDVSRLAKKLIAAIFDGLYDCGDD